jgi:hypothetical protein
VVAHLRHEERLAASSAVGIGLGEPVDAAVRRIDLAVIHVERIDVIALDPGAEEYGLVDDVVLELARADAVAAADALLDVDHHRPPVVRGLVAVAFSGVPAMTCSSAAAATLVITNILPPRIRKSRECCPWPASSENARVVRLVAGDAASPPACSLMSTVG